MGGQWVMEELLDDMRVYWVGSEYLFSQVFTHHCWEGWSVEEIGFSGVVIMEDYTYIGLPISHMLGLVPNLIVTSHPA